MSPQRQARSNRVTDIEIRLLISLSVPESSSIAPGLSLCLCVFVVTSLVNLPLFRPQMWKKDHISYRSRTRQQHRQTIDADAFARSRRHAVTEGTYVILVHLMRLLVAAFARLELRQKSIALVEWIVQFRIAVCDFHSADIQLESFDQTLVARLLLRQRRQLHWIIVDECRLNQMLRSEEH